MSESLPTERHKIFPHELSFLLLWAAVLVALGFKGAFKPVDLLGPVLISGLLIVMKKGEVGAWFQARMWFPFIGFNITYNWLGDAIPRLTNWRGDACLLSIDRALFGECLSSKVAPWVSGGVYELLSGAYLLFFPLFVTGFIVAARRGGKARTAFFSGFYLIYAIGFTGYALCPAAGPFRYEELAGELHALHPEGLISRLNDSIVRAGCNGVDVFPSLHTAATIFVLLSARTLSRRLFAVLLVPACLIVVATIGLQYHYAADVVAGAVLAVLVWRWFVRPLRKPLSIHSPS
ncbi:MAG: phosphatase PAP2 family protein [Luteolibacter sp.]